MNNGLIDLENRNSTALLIHLNDEWRWSKHRYTTGNLPWLTPYKRQDLGFALKKQITDPTHETTLKWA